MELTGKTAIVTGASGGLGGEIAIGLAKAGCDVVLCCNKNVAGAEVIARRIREFGRRAVIVQADLCDNRGGNAGSDGGAMMTGVGDLHAVWGQIVAACGGLAGPRILVNSAALFGRTPVGKIDAGSAARMLELDLLVPILLAQEFAAFVHEGSVQRSAFSVQQEVNKGSGQRTADGGHQEVRGKIVNIVDVGGERAWKEYSVYCAAKAGLIAATKSLAKELAPMITVNAVAPGVVTWPDGIDEAGKKRQLGFIPAGRIAQPQEIAATVVFLLQNDYITGQVINVDGGRST